MGFRSACSRLFCRNHDADYVDDNCTRHSLRNEAEVGPELEAVIGILAREFAGLSEGSAPSDIEAEDRVINAIRRQE